jgi:hypothetical protein
MLMRLKVLVILSQDLFPVVTSQCVCCSISYGITKFIVIAEEVCHTSACSIGAGLSIYTTVW